MLSEGEERHKENKLSYFWVFVLKIERFSLYSI